jgi:hypothetical protein
VRNRRNSCSFEQSLLAWPLQTVVASFLDGCSRFATPIPVQIETLSTQLVTALKHPLIGQVSDAEHVRNPTLRSVKAAFASLQRRYRRLLQAFSSADR